MFESKRTPGKKFGSAMVGKRYDEAHVEGGLHKLGGEEPKEFGSDKFGDGKKKSSEKTPNENTATSRTDAEGEAKNVMADTDVDQGEQKGMNMEENSEPEQHDEAQESRTDEKGESTGDEEVPEDVKSAAAEHGPASKIIVTHDKSTGRHSVASQHTDGHMHQSVHKDAKSAHASARHLGTPAPEPDDDDEYSHLLG